ncbi:transcriptional activator [Candidatus Scalindua japonica]|uniref:Transcriptional activator n=1 Tax=Candidatus Scalindua japonica TaxID=1284222 RepID=A0A286TVX9_9BACT|nr:hypothetical protein [Candidatus Scalindua japonica]GAX60004.1 transcriptional activator [Candidatus Scalindua japonica]
MVVPDGTTIINKQDHVNMKHHSFVKPLSGYIVLLFILVLVSSSTNAMWVKASDSELVEHSDVIITAELIACTQITIHQQETNIGILKVEEVLKGDDNQSAFLLALPSARVLRKSDDIFYKIGQKGLWCLRERKLKGEAGIYLADQPQRFTSEEHAAGQIEAIRKIVAEENKQ